MGQAFTKKLLGWHEQQNDRKMPWKGERDPYRIWISEIILQQTRVEQGRGYYERFLKAFPTLKKLAGARDEDVFKLWEGLGYYSRCRNLLATARWIMRENGGAFPNTYEGLLRLKGVGPYTAAAIASFAFHLPHAVVDGNVYRILARYFGIYTPVDETPGRHQFNRLAQSLLSQKHPGRYNQAIMDFGAVVCKPRNPQCTTCVFRRSCHAFQQGAVDQLPVKSKSTAVQQRWFNYYVLIFRNRVYVRARTTKDIWQHLYEFILSEQSAPFGEALPSTTAIKRLLGLPSTPHIAGHTDFRQKLSHQLIHARFILLHTDTAPKLPADYEAVSASRLHQLAFPGVINSFLQSHTLLKPPRTPVKKLGRVPVKN